MKDQLLLDLSMLHEKVAALKVYDRENAILLLQYAQEFEALLTQLLTFSAEKFKDVAASYHKTAADGNHLATVDVHDDTTDGNGFYDSVANLNDHINDAIEIVNGI